MDSYEATKLVFSRIQSLDPQNASKIMGLLLIQDHGDKEMIRLALGPQNVLHSLVLKARQHLSATGAGASSNIGSSSTLNPWTPPFYKGGGDNYLIHSSLAHRRSCSVSDVSLANSGFGSKPCLYYAKGFCKNGPTCNFVHHASALMMGDGLHRFNRARVDLNPASRQIYLTFPAHSTFREEDVSNYFSMYGGVEDVRIPYQQKRMFGFVTFVHPDTVKMILAKGNPHFVCDARVLVKPYKEKPKLLDNFRKQQQQTERGEFAACNSPIALDSHDPFDLQFGGKMGYESEYILWRRKLAEEQAELHHSLELQSRRLMGLQILDVKRNHHRSMSTGAPIVSPNSFFQQPLIGSGPSTPDASDENCASPTPLNYATDKEKESSLGEDNNNNLLLQSLDLPDSPFASPTKGASKFMTTFTSCSEAENSAKASSFGLHNITTTFDTPTFKSCYYQSPRYSSHGAIGM